MDFIEYNWLEYNIISCYNYKSYVYNRDLIFKATFFLPIARREVRLKYTGVNITFD